MDSVWILVSVTTLCVAALYAQRVFFRYKADIADKLEHLPGPAQADVQPYDDAELRSLINTLSAAVANGIEQVDRNNKRIEAVVRRARKELAEYDVEHAGLEAEAGGLRLIDGSGSPAIELPEVSETVDTPPDVGGHSFDPPSAVPGFSNSELAAWREMRSEALNQ